MTPTLATFLIELVNFLVLAGLLGWLLFKPVRGMLKARQAAEQQHTAALAARNVEIDQLRSEWQTRIAAFERETAETRRAQLAAAEQEAAAILARARSAAERERTRATETLLNVEHAQIAELATTVAAAAREAVEHLLATIEAPDLGTRLVRAACRQLQALDGSLGSVVVESAAPLDDDDRQAIVASLGRHTPSPIFRIAPDLGAGVRIMTARGLIDASAAGVAAQVERRLNARLATRQDTA